MLFVYCDGAVEPKNPGGWGVGGWVVKDEDGARLAEGARDFGCYPELTNNVVEYGAIKAALDFLASVEEFGEKIVVRSDSQLVINQINDVYRTQSKTLRPLRDAIWKLLEQFDDVTFEWIPREQNTDADAMSRSMYRADRMKGGPQDEVVVHDRQIHVPLFLPDGKPNAAGLSQLKPLQWLRKTGL